MEEKRLQKEEQEYMQIQGQQPQMNQLDSSSLTLSQKCSELLKNLGGISNGPIIS